MFEYNSMSPALTLEDAPPQRAALWGLRQKIHEMETPGINQRVYPVCQALEGLFPDGGLRRGSIYHYGFSSSLLWTLVAEATRQGVWCALIGLPNLGVAAADDMGVDVDRLVFVPSPGNQWISVVGALADVVGIVAVGATPAPSERTLSTLAGRLRERETTLLVGAVWPRVEARIDVTAHQWHGLGRGHGLLHEHRVSLALTPRHGHPIRRCDVIIDAWGVRSAEDVAGVVDLASYRTAG